MECVNQTFKKWTLAFSILKIGTGLEPAVGAKITKCIFTFIFELIIYK